MRFRSADLTVCDVLSRLLNSYGARHIGVNGTVIWIRPCLCELMRIGLSGADDRSTKCACIRDDLVGHRRVVSPQHARPSRDRHCRRLERVRWTRTRSGDGKGLLTCGRCRRSGTCSGSRACRFVFTRLRGAGCSLCCACRGRRRRAWTRAWTRG